LAFTGDLNAWQDFEVYYAGDMSQPAGGYGSIN